MKKRLLSIIVLILAIVMALSSCVDSVPTIEISEDGYWVINGEKTDVLAKGEKGEQGDNGDSISFIDENPQGLAFYLKDDGTYVVEIGYAKYLSKIEIPATYKGKPVTEIGSFGSLITATDEGDCIVFGGGNEILREITIPDSITIIGKESFDGCLMLNYNEYDNGYYLGNSSNPYLALVDILDKSVTTINININTKIIAASIFEDCENLTDVYYPGTIADWCDISFSDFSANPMCRSNVYLNGESIKNELIIPNTVTEIKRYTFASLESLISVVIPDSVTSIGEGAFWLCNDINNVVLGKSVVKIGTAAFSGCTQLTEISFPDSIKSIGYGAFAYCDNLSEIVIGKSTETIGYAAFLGCERITSVEIPNSVKSIDEYAFSLCCDLAILKYHGSETEWNAVGKHSRWDYQTGNYTITYNYTGE